MRKILLVSLGGAIGYALGARAGRPAYDRMVGQWSRLASAVGAGELAATVREAGADVRDSALGRASSAVATTADAMTARIDEHSTALGHDGAVVTAMGPEADGY